jgi:hypothetical protein
MRKSQSLALTMPGGAMVRGALSFTEGETGPVIVFAHGFGSTRPRREGCGARS